VHALLLAAVIAAAPASASKNLGVLRFPITGNAKCQAHFTEGMLALHSFEYGRAHDAFQRAAAADPKCLMAHWGDAMAYSHPIWAEEDVPAARAALAKIGPSPAVTEKERAFIAAARALFEGEGNMAERAKAWLAATKQLRERWPTDDEMALQHALALMMNSDHFKNTKRLMESAAVSQDVFRRQPMHPGAAHYVIHAFDSPEHAVLGLEAARRYAKIAPAAAHALHMPSHIFVQLGMYEDAAASNEVSYAASVKLAQDKKAGYASYGWHSYEWLAASYFELGQIQKGEKLLADLAGYLEKEDSPSMRQAHALLVRLALTRANRWDRIDALLAPVEKKVPLAEGEDPASMGCGLHAPGAAGKTRGPTALYAFVEAAMARGEGAARAGDEKRALDAKARLAKVLDAMKPWDSLHPPQLRRNLGDGMDALVAIAKARQLKTDAKAWKEAFDRARAVAQTDDGEPAQGPAFFTPMRQLLAELELERGNAAQARLEFERTLDKHPMLSRALLGAARAAKAMGDLEGARKHYGTLAQLWRKADADLPELNEVATGAQLQASRAVP
jgi:hypothetical protein